MDRSKFSRILSNSFALFIWILSDFPGVSSILSDYFRLFWIFSEFGWILPYFYVVFLILPDFHVFPRILSDFFGFSHILLNRYIFIQFHSDFPNFFRILADSFQCCRNCILLHTIRSRFFSDYVVFFRNICLFFGFCWILSNYF